MPRQKGRLTNGPDKNIERPILDVCRTPKIDQLDLILAIKNNVLVLDIPMHHQSLGVQMMQGSNDLQEDIPTLGFLHGVAHLDVVKEIHARQAVRLDFDIVVCVIFEKVDHFHDVGVLEPIAADVVKDVNLERDGAEPAV